MQNDSDIELWDDSSEFTDTPPAGQCWKILIVDDDPEVHKATAYTLHDVRIFDRGLELIFASSLDEAIAKSQEAEEIAVAVIDVVMETADAGLNLVKALRQNEHLDTRLILRTGFPGYAPELSVVNDYEIDGYFTKEELTRTRLISLLTTSIRAFENIRMMSRSREGLELIVASARQLFKRNDLEMFAEGVLKQVTALLRGSTSGLVSGRNADGCDMHIITGIGSFAGQQGKTLAEVDGDLNALCEAEVDANELFRKGDYLGMRFETNEGAVLLAAIEADRDIGQPELDLLRLFATNINIGFQNLSLLEALNVRAYTDPRLELPNLNAFEDALRETLEKKRSGYVVKVYVCDYQAHVATYGNGVARKLMQAAFQRLQALTENTCTIAVVSEGTFGIIDREKRLSPEKICGAMKETYVIDGIELAPNPTSVITEISDLPDSEAEAVTAVTAALVHVRSSNDGTHVIYGSPEREAWKRRNILQQALKADSQSFDGLVTYLQPQVDLTTGQTIGAEALLRWEHEGEAISPVEFIPIAEASGLTRALTGFVLREAARWARSYRWSDGRPLPIAVNLSMADLNVPGFGIWLLRQLEELELQPDQIAFEITEAIAMSGKVAIRQIHELSRHGYSISLDDFGTGYSSLGQLERLPFKALKIDRSFVRRLTPETAASSLCSVIVGMSDLLGMDCVAEGIETEEQREAICRMGCRHGQGFLFGRPMPMADFSQNIGLVASKT